MSDYWLGFITPIMIYFAVGTIFGLYTVLTHLAHFFSAGFQYNRMLKHFGMCVVLWPAAILEVLG